MATQTPVQAKQILSQMGKQISSQMEKQLGATPLLWMIPWSTYSQGAHAPALPAGLAFARASTQYLRQDSGGGVAYASGTASANTPVVGTIGAVTGLLLDASHTNLITGGRGAAMGTTPWNAGANPASIGVAAGIDGTAGDGSQFACTSGNYCNFTNSASIAQGATAVSYCYAKPVGSAITWRFSSDYINGSLVVPAGGTLTNGVWQTISTPPTVSGGVGVATTIPCEGRAAGGGFPAAAQGPYLIDMVEVCVDNHVPLTWHDSTMAGIGVSQADPTQTVRNGAIEVQIDFNIPYPLAESNFASLPLWSASTDPTTFVNFDTVKGQFRTSVGGVEVLFPTSILSLITTTCVIRCHIAAGNGVPVGSYAISTDGGATFPALTSLGTVTTTQPAIVLGTQSLDFGSTGTTAQAEGVHVTWSAYGIGSTPYVPQTAFYAAVVATGTGSGLTPGNAASLVNGLALARAALTGTNEVVLYLRQGTYYLHTIFGGPLVTTASDLGLQICSYPGEVAKFSGATVITGWTVFSGNIYQASVPVGTRAPHITVNGVRSQLAGFQNLTALSGWTANSTGFTAPNSTVAGYHEPTAGFLYSAVPAGWKFFFVPIASAIGTAVTANTLAWNAANFQTIGASPPNAWQMTSVFGVANVREAIANPGDFAIEPGSGTVYYQIRPGDVMTSSPAELPVLDTLVTGIGTQGAPVSGIQFHGIVFCDTNCTDALTNGWSVLQASVQGRGTQGVSETYTTLPGAVSMIYATDFVFAGCQFLRCGGLGIRMDKGCKGNVVIGSTFDQTGGAPVTFGWVLQANQRPSNPADKVSFNSVLNCTFTNVGVNFWSSCAHEAYFVDNLVIDHCTINGTTYTCASIGWGWGYAESGGFEGSGWPTDQPPAFGDTVATNNSITNCRISNIGSLIGGLLGDGGGVYTVGKEPGSVAAYNYVSHLNGNLRSLYQDNDSQGWTFNNNVVDTFAILVTLTPLPAIDNTWENNYSSVVGAFFVTTPDASNTLINNVFGSGNPWPAPALAVIASAGR